MYFFDIAEFEKLTSPMKICSTRVKKSCFVMQKYELGINHYLPTTFSIQVLVFEQRCSAIQF